MKLAAAALLVSSMLLSSAPASAQRYNQVNLVSDLSGQALNTDSHLVNPWGIVPGPTGVFWVSNNGTSTSTLYDPDGTIRSLVVTIPGQEPTGVVLAAAADSSFRIPSADSTARAVFIFVTQVGTITAWSPLVNPTNAIQVASVADANYTGAAIGGPAATPHLYAANFHAGTIDVFDRDFQKVSLSGNFTDPGLPADYTPFNVANIGGQLFVTYAQTADFNDETQGPGLGLVDVFDLNGNFIKRFTTGGSLNAPWGVVAAPSGFGSFGGAILVGNLGDGHINAFNAGSGSSLGALQDSTGAVIGIPGLWGLHFGAAASGSQVAGRLYFAAGIQDEKHGLFGYFSPVRVAGEPACDNLSKGVGFWRQTCRRSSEDFPPGKGNGRGNDQGRGNGHGNGNGNDNAIVKLLGRGHNPFGTGGVSADSLDALLGCVTSSSSAFGAEGCFTASCDFLSKVGQRSDRDLAAQQLLALRLNVCSGLVCEDLVLGCSGEVGNKANLLTVGEVADSLDFLLCNGGSTSDLHAIVALIECANNGGDENGEGEGDHNGDRAFLPKIGVRTFGSSPMHLGGDAVRMSVSTTAPAVVRLRIYDAAGRLVAEPMRNSLVSGTVEVKWDGRSVRGGLVPPGNYFYRATAGGEASTGRIVIVH